MSFLVLKWWNAIPIPDWVVFVLFRNNGFIRQSEIRYTTWWLRWTESYRPCSTPSDGYTWQSGWTLSSIATNKALFIRKMLISFLFLHENICCGYSLEAPRWGTSNEYPQHMFLERNKKNIMWIPPLSCSYAFIPKFLKWTLPFLNLDFSTDANRVSV